MGQVKVWGCRPQSRTSKTKFLILGFSVVRSCFWSLVQDHWSHSAPQRCNAERSDAQRKFFTSQVIPPFLQRHRCDALHCFSASPVIIFYIAHIAFPPLLPFFLSPPRFTVQNNKEFIKSHNAAMSPQATRDGHRKRKRKRSDAVH